MPVTVTPIPDERDERQWFRLDGTDYGTNYTFEGEEFARCHGGTLLDCDGCPLVEGDTIHTAVDNALRDHLPKPTHGGARPGSGRKDKPRYGVRLVANVSPAMAQAFESAVEKQSTKSSAALREAIAQWAARNGG